MSQTPKRRQGSRRENSPEDSSVVPLRDLDTLENTMPPTPLRELLAADGASVFVFSDDTALLAIVQEAGGEQYPVFPAPTWQALRDAIVERRCGIALLDIDAVSGELIDRIAEIARLNPALVTLVASARDRADGLLNLLSQRRIHRLLIKPPTVGITRLLLESSVNRHIELKRRAEVQAPARATQPPSSFAGWRSWVIAGVLVPGVIAAVAVGAYFTARTESVQTVVRIPDAEPALEVPQAAAAPVPATPQPAALEAVSVVDVPTALGSPSSIDGSAPPAEFPAGVTAEAAAGAAAATPAESEVPPGPDPAEIEAQYAAVEAALLGDDLDAAEASLSNLAAVDPGSTRLAFLASQLERARLSAAEVAEAQAAAVLAAEAAAAPSELSSLIGLARARLSQRQVLAPAGDSALDYYERGRMIDPTAPELDTLSAEIGAAVLTAAEVELAGNRFANAEGLFVRARELGVADAELAGLELSLALARESLAREAEEAMLATAIERLAQGQVFEPAGASALAAAVELRGLNPDHPGLPGALAAIRAALEPLAGAALDVGDWTRAEATIAALEQADAPADVVTPLRDELVFAERQAAYLAEVAPASELSVVRLVPPSYPNRALTRNLEGWVDLEFVVDREGAPRDIVVVSAEPPDIFDAAAVEAAAQYVFVPFERDGRVYERRVQVRLRFALQ